MDTAAISPAVSIPVLVALYLFFAFCLYRLGQLLGDARAWWAWIPVLQVFFMLKIAQLSYWWFIGLLIPFLNIAVGVYVWIRIAARRAKPWWVGVLMVVPGVDLAVLAYLAFSK
jgi:hypothetical protein